MFSVSRQSSLRETESREESPVQFLAGLTFALKSCALFALIASTSCISSGDSRISREGYSEPLRTALDQQNFRGRWWSFYERSRILNEFEQWEDAKSDLEVALSLRDRDQWRARTYGMHFTSEYFPNREMGVVLFAQERYDEALPYLETSVRQQFSARGAFYLNKARERSVRQSGADTLSPTFNLIAPSSETALSDIEVDIVGIAADDTYVTAVEINGESVPIRISGRTINISHRVNLSPGENRVAVRITDIVGRVTEETFRFAADHDGPAVSFDNAAGVQGRVAGIVFDPSGVESLEIGGLPVRLVDALDGSFRFETTVDGTVALADLAFECVDALGNATSGIVPRLGQTTIASRERVRVAAASIPPQLLAAQDDSSIRVAFTNLREGQRYLSDQIVVGLAIEAPAPVASIVMDGQSIDGLVPGRRLQRITRRIPLESVGAREISVTVTDIDGNAGNAYVKIERRLTQIDEMSARLHLAMLGNLWTSQRAEFEGYVDYITDELPLILSDRGRFRVLQRDDIDLVLDEQALIEALGSSDAISRLGNLELTDFVLIGDLRRYGSNLEILLHAVDSLTTRETVVDVYGPASNLEELHELVENLALRLEQEFPRVQGIVIRGGSGRVVTDLNELDRIRRAMRCIVFRKEEVFDPVSGESLGIDLIPLAEGSLREVRSKTSTVQILERLSEDGSSASDSISYVLTK